ncbi:MAG: hypothetical protein HKN29_03840 [Rhodothermales bacterium]|nr:hypothetical protein [Rhodothermales bacterium]
MRAILLGLLLWMPLAANGQVLDAGDPPAMAELRAELLRGPMAPEAESWFPGARAQGARSIPLASGLSALVPGAGQAYNRTWTKAAIALGLEATVFAVWSITRSRGLSGEDDFRAFAHAEWDPVQYGRWLNDYVTYLQQEFGHQVSAPPASAPLEIDFTRPEAWSSSEQSAVNAYFNQIQAIERQVFHPETGATFSHQLPDFADQQYYELIGKYFQFAPGWEDYPAWVLSDGSFTPAIDPEQTGPGNTKPNVSATFYRYAEEHAAAQDLLRTASHLSSLFVVNHLLAAIDAAVTAKLRNDRISTAMTLEYQQFGPPAPTVSLRVRL